MKNASLFEQIFRASPAYDSIERVNALRVTFDGGDVDEHGHWLLAGVCCLDCRHETARLQPWISLYEVVLACAECGRPLSPAFNQFSGRVK
jgi:hypothetical protein